MKENTSGKFRQELREVPFESYAEYMDYVFASVNVRMTDYIQGLMGKYATGQGQFKNVMYPDIEIAYNLCNDNVVNFFRDEEEADADEIQDDTLSEMDDELQALLGEFSAEVQEQDEDDVDSADKRLGAEEMLSFIEARIAITEADKYPFYQLCACGGGR